MNEFVVLYITLNSLIWGITNPLLKYYGSESFEEKNNIGSNGFSTLEDYEQQRVFHFIEESNDFKKLVRKGIPMEYRAVMWYITR